MNSKDFTYFNSTFELYNKYKEICIETAQEGFRLNYTIEGLDKLLQLEILYKKIVDFQEIASDRDEGLQEIHKAFNSFFIERGIVRDENSGFPQSFSMQSTKRFYEMLFETKIFVESFYYFAFRLRNIIRYSPGLGKKFECPGIRNVRNLLIEHPEKADHDFVNSLAVGDKKVGITLQAIRLAGDKSFKDPGFFYNLEEFKNNLESVLISFINKKKQP